MERLVQDTTGLPGSHMKMKLLEANGTKAQSMWRIRPSKTNELSSHEEISNEDRLSKELSKGHATSMKPFS